MDHRCPHRVRVPLLRPQRGGRLRCVYHGWKFDVARQLRGHAQRALRVRPQAPGQGEGVPDLRAQRPGLGLHGRPRRGAAAAAAGGGADPRRRGTVRFVQRECNWLQALEGDIDTSHFGFLHAGSAQPEDFQEDHPMRHTVTDRAPEYHVTDTDWGTSYGAHRKRRGRQDVLARRATSCFPFWTQTPQCRLPHQRARARLGADGRHPHHGGDDRLEQEHGRLHRHPAQERQAHPRLRARHRLPARHHRLVRPLPGPGPAPRTTTRSTAKPSATTRSTPASAWSSCRTRR